MKYIILIILFFSSFPALAGTIKCVEAGIDGLYLPYPQSGNLITKGKSQFIERKFNNTDEYGIRSHLSRDGKRVTSVEKFSNPLLGTTWIEIDESCKPVNVELRKNDEQPLRVNKAFCDSAPPCAATAKQISLSSGVCDDLIYRSYDNLNLQTGEIGMIKDVSLDQCYKIKPGECVLDSKKILELLDQTGAQLGDVSNFKKMIRTVGLDNQALGHKYTKAYFYLCNIMRAPADKLPKVVPSRTSPPRGIPKATPAQGT